jgi:hypothetical protein
MAFGVEVRSWPSRRGALVAFGGEDALVEGPAERALSASSMSEYLCVASG